MKNFLIGKSSVLMRWLIMMKAIQIYVTIFIPRPTLQLTSMHFGFSAMCRYYLGKEEYQDDVKLPQWRVNDDIIEHHFHNLRAAGRDNDNPDVRLCCQAVRHSTVVRLTRESGGNSEAVLHCLLVMTLGMNPKWVLVHIIATMRVKLVRKSRSQQVNYG